MKEKNSMNRVVVHHDSTGHRAAITARERDYWRDLAETRGRRVNRLALLLAALGLWMALDGTIRLLSAFGLLG